MSIERVPVLMYHRVGKVRDQRAARFSITPADFSAHMRALARSGYHAVSMHAFLAWMEAGQPLTEGAFLLTFDDGYRGVLEHAQPVLEELRWPFNIFLVSDLIGGTDAWIKPTGSNDESHPLLNAQEILDMRQHGCEFHSHARSHPRLTELSDAELADQLGGSRAALTELLGQEVTCLAYPFGLHDDRVVAAARAAGYRAAFSTRSGFNNRRLDRYRIRRLDVQGNDSPAMLLRKIRLGSNDGRRSTMIRYYLRNIVSRIGGRP